MGTNKTLAVVDLATGQTRDVPLDGFPDTVAFSPDGTGLAVYYGGESAWAVLDVAALREGRLEYLSPTQPLPEQPRLGDDLQRRRLADHHDGQRGGRAVGRADARPAGQPHRREPGRRRDGAPAGDGHTVLIAQPRGKVLTWDTRPQHVIDIGLPARRSQPHPGEWTQYVEDHEYERTCPELG